ncbi:MAG: hypothetical protein ABFD86_17970 [Bryobacteraceae bacterium]
MTQKLIRLPEPTLLFRHSQAMEDPRDGLTLFGPLDEISPYGIRAGVVGTKEGIRKYRNWVQWIQGPIRLEPPNAARPPFPGFESAFRIPWAPDPILSLEINESELKANAGLDDRHQRVFKTVNVYAHAIEEALTNEEARPDVWFVIIPDYVRRYCRPRANVAPEDRIAAIRYFSSAKQAKIAYDEPFLFEDLNVAAEPYLYKEHFRNQLKARLLKHTIATQVLREGTLDNLGNLGDSRREKGLRRLQSQIVWNVATTAFYKADGRPWKTAGIRDGVCYIGLVFKKDERGTSDKSAACGAQMFLDSGDGLVFKGAPGRWYDTKSKNFHLSREAARDLVGRAVAEYKRKREHQEPPTEVFIHGKVEFWREEWEGFREAVGAGTKVVGVKIRDDSTLKLFRDSDTPILRGSAYLRNERSAYLWTRGWTPRLATYPGMEVPNPLSVEICQGEAEMGTVLKDILALTKLNYNACLYADGVPITLKFAEAVGEVLTSGPLPEKGPPLPFRYYI